MDYDFRRIEKDWQQKWNEAKAYKVSNDSPKPSFYVLDMFPYPSGSGLHVGHPLGYIASDIYSRYKRLKGFNVLHPMGFDSFGLPAEQYALETGQHPATTTEKNIATFKEQLDKIGFCYDWSREVRTSDPSYYKWTQWIFLKLYNSYFCNTEQKARLIADLIEKYSTKGAMPKSGEMIPGRHFTADQWNAFTKAEQEEILMKRRLAFSAFGEVNWCEALGTVLANDEVVNGVSERGGHPVIKKKMRQWYLRITDYAERLLQGLETVDFSDSMKEMQRNWIGRSEGAEMEFPLIPDPSPQGVKGAGENDAKGAALVPKYNISTTLQYEFAKLNRKNYTEAENILWQELRNNKLGEKFRRQHPIKNYIADFICLQKALIIEADGGYHESEEQKQADDNRERILNEIGFTVLRFTNEEIITTPKSVLQKISEVLKIPRGSTHPSPRSGEGQGVRVYTTRPDTIFGVDFLVLAPEHNLVNKITTAEQKHKIEEYLTYVKSRSDRERMAEVKQITGCFTGAYAKNPFNGKAIPVWIAEYVLGGYGTGAIMAVPSGDQRDFAFAKHFNIPITNIIGDAYTGEEANPTKEATLYNSDFLDGMQMKDAIAVAINKIEELGIGKKKINYRMRDAGFSRQRYWGEPFPIVWEDGVAIALNENELPLELPHAEKYGPGPEGEGPLANITKWVNLTPNPSPKEREVEEHPEAQKGYGYINSTPQEWKNTLAFAKQNRHNQNEAEGIIWELVRNRKIDGHKFRRQHPVSGFIPDFICLEQKLILEIDGEYHDEEGQALFDIARENWLNEFGFEIIRFTNQEVTDDLGKIEKAISQKLTDQQKKHIVHPPLPRRGVGGEVFAARRETSTMPGYAGSSWYFLRYMDPKNDQTFCDRKASDYWGQVDVYVGGTEHAVGHLFYSRMWTKVLYDLGLIGFDEPFKKLVNQGMIQGSSRFVYRITFPKTLDEFKRNMDAGLESIDHNKSYFISFGIFQTIEKLSPDLAAKYLESYLPQIGNIFSGSIIHSKMHADVNMVDGFELNIDEFRKWKNGEYQNAIFICEDGRVDTPLSFGEGLGVRSKYICGSEIEKMSKSKYNTVNPDVLVEKYGADTFRMYEMFLGPVEQSKPWDTKGIEGVHRFLKKLWRLFYDDVKGQVWTAPSPSERAGGEATDAEFKVLHKTIKKIEQDTESFSYNTAVSAFMVCVNELTDLKCHKKEILEKVLILLSPYAPHVSEELWHCLGNEGFVIDAAYPLFEKKYLLEATKEYPVSINGKMRTSINLPTEVTQQEAEQAVLANETVQKWLKGKKPKKFIFVKGRMINIVI